MERIAAEMEDVRRRRPFPEWALVSWAQGMLSIIPEVNLVSTIGFGADATHTCGANIYAAMSVSPMTFPLRHPQIVLPASETDAYTVKRMLTRSLIARAMLRMQGFARKLSAGVQ